MATEMMGWCPQCGSPRQGDERFCSRDGTPFEQPSSTAALVPAPTPRAEQSRSLLSWLFGRGRAKPGTTLAVMSAPLANRSVTPTVTQLPAVPEFTGVTYGENGSIDVSTNTVTEAKLAIKELRRRKRELGVTKREINEKMREIRAAYTDQVRSRSPMMRGGGGFGRAMRMLQTGSRAGTRQQLARELAPWEVQRATIERHILLVDGVITRMEAQLAAHR